MQSGNRRGVMVPPAQGAKTDEGPANTVAHAVKGEMIAVQYYDERGRARNVVVFKVGDSIYVPENSEAWASNLKPASKWLQNALAEKLSSGAAAGPKRDAVDVVPHAASTPTG